MTWRFAPSGYRLPGQHPPDDVARPSFLTRPNKDCHPAIGHAQHARSDVQPAPFCPYLVHAVRTIGGNVNRAHPVTMLDDAPCGPHKADKWVNPIDDGVQVIGSRHDALRRRIGSRANVRGPQGRGVIASASCSWRSWFSPLAGHRWASNSRASRSASSMSSAS